ncbi:paraneoplastic antigen Ma2 homolog [Pseudophryne corroboree]|uniref:paraneoplastic antigen Ma2 homolog n=1 Tax=Pseudophryne corroboree TaxID=495146 RepID=UPI003081BF7C
MEEVSKEDIFRWCHEKDIDVDCSFGLRGNLNNASEDSMINAVKFLYGINEPRIVDKWKGSTGTITAVLITNQNALDPMLLPGMVVVEGVPGWKVPLVWPERNPVGEEEGPTGGEHGTGEPHLIGGVPTAGLNTDPITHSEDKVENQVETVMGKMVSHLERWHFEGGYRRLRIFSGITPVPAGEETYELWREAATQHSEEWQCPEHVKRQRVVESLRGPAMGVIQATRRSNPNATLKDYVEALDFSFGTLEDVGDLLARLNHTYQEPGETLTHYIYRVDRLIYKIVDKGGIDKEGVDRRRLTQVIKGALTNSTVAQRLRCTMNINRPPTLNELVREVKLEEVQIENREKTIKKVKVVLPTPSSPSIDERLLKLIEDQNKKIEQLIALQTNPPYSQGMRNDSGGEISVRRVSRFPTICYSCGQAGHRSFECPMYGHFQRGNNNNYRRRLSTQENANGSAVDPSQAPQ